MSVRPSAWVPFTCPFSGNPIYLDCWEIVAVEGLDVDERACIGLRNAERRTTVDGNPTNVLVKIERVRDAIRAHEARITRPNRPNRKRRRSPT